MRKRSGEKQAGMSVGTAAMVGFLLIGLRLWWQQDYAGSWNTERHMDLLNLHLIVLPCPPVPSPPLGIHGPWKAVYSSTQQHIGGGWVRTMMAPMASALLVLAFENIKYFENDLELKNGRRKSKGKGCFCFGECRRKSGGKMYLAEHPHAAFQ